MENSINQPNHTKAAFLIIALYVIARMVAEPFFWSHVSIYYSYIFEILFVIVTWFVLRPAVSLQKISKLFIIVLLSALFLGLFTHHYTYSLNLIVPFDFSSLETIFLLLVIAPVLEETIFRLALWEAFHQFIKNKFSLIFVTSFLFMAGHLSAYFFVPAEYRSFLLYQAAYVFLLGFFLGTVRLKTSSINASMLVHLAFNLGFLISGKFWA